MKRSRPLLIIAGLCISLLCYWQLSLYRTPASQADSTPEPIPAVAPRESITFILGTDKDDNNPYYREATHYYQHHPEGRAHYLVTHLRSLLEVRDYLERHKPDNGLPWGLVNLVSHGNAWTGLSATVVPGGKRTTASRLEEIIAQGGFTPLPDSIVDDATQIFVHGCGIGNDEALINAIAHAFGGEGLRPIAMASRLFEYYASVSDSDSIYSVRYLADTWMVSYPMGEQPSHQLLVNELRERYPGVTIDWYDALSRQQPRWPGDAYHYTFEVPVKWLLAVPPDSLPDIHNNEALVRWIGERSDVVQELKRLGLPLSRFAWSALKVYTDDPSGDKIPALRVKGYCTMLAVLRPIIPSGNEPSSGDALVWRHSKDYYSTPSTHLATANVKKVVHQ